MIKYHVNAKSQLIGIDPDAGKDWRQKEKRAAEDMIRYPLRLDSITDSMDLSMSKLQEIVKDRRVMQSMQSQRIQHDLETEQEPCECIRMAKFWKVDNIKCDITRVVTIWRDGNTCKQLIEIKIGTAVLEKNPSMFNVISMLVSYQQYHSWGKYLKEILTWVSVDHTWYIYYGHILSVIIESESHLSSVQFSRSVMSDFLRPHELQHTRPPCPSPTPGVYPNSCPSSRWCHPAISSSVIPFFCPQSLPASGSFPMCQLFTWGHQSVGVSALASLLPMNTQDWSPLGWTGWISLQSKGLSRVFSNTTVQKHQFFGTQLSS